MKWEIIILIALFIFGGYFAFKYYSLCYALKKAEQECVGLTDDVTQNQILHLPLPNKQLADLLSSFNLILKEIQLERQKYNMREKEFKKQIENISHDLRTPLTVILGYIKLVKKDTIMDEELLEAMEIINQKATVMAKLLAEFYDYSRLNANNFEIILESVDIVKILRESLMGHHQVLEKSNLELEVDLQQTPLWVLGNTMALERIFTNLFQNASRYATSFLKIEICKKENEVSILFVNDTTKLLQSELSNIFDRFYIQDYSRSQGGTGLGLTIAKSLAIEMRADLTAYPVSLDKVESDEIFKICFDLNIKLS